MALVLVCQVEQARYGLLVAHVEETLRPLPLHALAGAAPFVLGAAIVRGVPAPVIDAAAVLGGAALPSPRRWVMLRLGARRAALAVDEVIGVRSLPTDRWGALDPLLGSATSAIDALGAIDRELLVVLQAGKLVPDSVWTALAATSP